MGKNKADIPEEPKDAAALLGYLRIVEIGPDLFRGAILLTDLRGKPRDFRCTSAIKPNAIQRILYGGTLSEHMALDLCGLPLLKALPVQPSVLLADRPDLLVLRPQTDIPMLWLRRQSEIHPQGRPDVGSDAELVASEGGLFETVLASGHAEHGGDLPKAAEWVRQIAQALDPLEPFSRIEAALKLVQDKAGQGR
jgi:hypothetical protein